MKNTIKQVYVGSSLHNGERARQLMDRLEQEGIQITYDWTTHGQVYSEEELTKLGALEEKGVLDCDVFLLVLPGRNGTHFEFGLAHGKGKHIVMLEEVEVEQKTFYYLPGIARYKTEDDVVQHILTFFENTLT
jgi:nucleoside 2-deoxyribosyltransferase